jgi:hypothetical protein
MNVELEIKTNRLQNILGFKYSGAFNVIPQISGADIKINSHIYCYGSNYLPPSKVLNVIEDHCHD